MQLLNNSTALLLLVTTFLVISGCSSSSDENNNDPIATFDSGNIAPDQSYSYTFDQEGTVEYYCELHAPNMQGAVTISSSAEPAEQDTVVMANDSFQPRDVTIAPDTELVWVNNQDHAHTVVSGNPSSDDDGDGPDY